jgi:hypothetical protein
VLDHLAPSAGLPVGTWSRLWRHDPTEQPSAFGDALVSHTGSMESVDLPRPGEQLALVLDLPRPGEQLALVLGLDVDQLQDVPPQGIDTIALF